MGRLSQSPCRPQSAHPATSTAPAAMPHGSIRQSASTGADWMASGAPPTVGQLSSAMEVDRRFADLGLGLVDGSVIALAEFLSIRRLATRDVRHFAAVRLRDGRPFALVVRPTNPDQS